MSQKNDVKKVTIVEFHPTQSPLEETKEELSTESVVPPEEFLEKYLDLEEQLLHLVCIQKNKRSAEWIRKTNEILKEQVEIREYRRVTSDFIREYLDDLRFFSIKINELIKKISLQGKE